jgi:hypothetical protein
VRQDLETLSAALPGLGRDLLDLPFAELLALLDRLDADRDSMDFLPKLTASTLSLEALGLGPLLADLHRREAGPSFGQSGPEAQAAVEAVVCEIDFAWWSSVLAYALEDRPQLGTMDGKALDALVASYRELDVAHTATKPEPIRVAAIGWRVRAEETYPAQAFKLAHVEPGATLRAVLAAAPEVGCLARPCILAGTVMVPQALPLAELGGPPLDLVIVDGADAMSPAEAAAAIARGRQVIVVGDSARAASGTLTRAIGEVLPRVPLPDAVNERDPRVTGLLEEEGYTTLGSALPVRVRSPRITWTHVDAVGQVAGGATRIDASAPEIEAAVKLVEIHLRRWPGESLAVFTATPVYAERLEAALRHAAKSGSATLAAALTDRGPESLLVAPADEALGVSRDAVILAAGLAKSPRGTVMYEFGVFSGDEGASRLTDVLLAGRRRLTVVSSLAAEDLEDDRLRLAGPRLFKRVLMAASHPWAVAASISDLVDPLFEDLARRVERYGIRVTPNYGYGDQSWIKLAARPLDGPAREVVAVLTDDLTAKAATSVRAWARFRPEALERAGWRLRYSWTTPVFMDPEAEAAAIAVAVNGR